MPKGKIEFNERGDCVSKSDCKSGCLIVTGKGVQINKYVLISRRRNREGSKKINAEAIEVTKGEGLSRLGGLFEVQTVLVGGDIIEDITVSTAPEVASWYASASLEQIPCCQEKGHRGNGAANVAQYV